jgi:N-acetylmuramoyl-L-alanine amidase
MRTIKILICAMLATCAAGCDERAGRISLLAGDPSIDEFISLEADSVTMYASPDDRREGRIECRVYADEYQIFTKMFNALDDASIVESYRSKGSARFTQDFIKKVESRDPGEHFNGETRAGQPLSGMRIAIDPGHSAGTFNEAILENKYMWIYTQDGGQLKFYEAQLNLATAFILKDMLEKDGARVMLTRDSGRQSYPVSFETWSRRYFFRAVRDKLRSGHITDGKARRLLAGAGDEMRLKFFNSEVEMPYRAKLINTFRPHVTVLVHYDSMDDTTAYRSKYLRIKDIVGKKHAPQSRKLREIEEVVKSVSETDQDYCTVFVPGCFLKGELNSMESRIEFLRLVITPDLDNSIRYSKDVLKNFKKFLTVPPAHGTSIDGKAVGFCSRGLYARNFRMTRLVRGTLCLGEPLLQNNMKEALDLSVITDGTVPDRVKQVAKAYYDAIVEYANKR